MLGWWYRGAAGRLDGLRDEPCDRVSAVAPVREGGWDGVAGPPAGREVLSASPVRRGGGADRRVAVADGWGPRRCRRRWVGRRRRSGGACRHGCRVKPRSQGRRPTGMSTPRLVSWCTWTSKSWAGSGRSANACSAVGTRSRRAGWTYADVAVDDDSRHARSSCATRASVDCVAFTSRRDPHLRRAGHTDPADPHRQRRRLPLPRVAGLLADHGIRHIRTKPYTPEPMAKPKPSSASSNANRHTARLPIQQPPRQALPGGCAGTTTTDHTAESAAATHQPRLTRCEVLTARRRRRCAGVRRPRRVEGVLEQQAMVIGPTPPGTGVIAPAPLAAARSRRRRPAFRRRAVDADVDDRGAGLDQSPRTISRPADGGDERRRRGRDSRGRSRVREWARSRWRPPAAAAAPSAGRRCCERPTTTARRRAAATPVVASSASAARRARHEAAAGEPAAEVQGVEAVDVLAGIDARRAPACGRGLRAAAAAPGCRRRRRRRSAVDGASTSACGVAAGRRLVERLHSHLAASLALALGRTPARPDPPPPGR